jgi:hypothetical protein
VITREVGEGLLHTQIPFGGLNRRMPQRDLDLLEGSAALVGQFGEGAADVVGRECGAEPVSVSLDHLVDGLGAHSCPVIRCLYCRRRAPGPPPKPAVASQLSTAAFAQAGMGTVRIRLPLPARSTMHHRPSRCSSHGHGNTSGLSAELERETVPCPAAVVLPPRTWVPGDCRLGRQPVSARTSSITCDFK